MKIQRTKIETAILRVFSECQIHSFPFDCKELLRFYGYKCIAYTNLSPAKRQACVEISDDAFCLQHKVYYNNTMDSLRLRFTLMHELGHICLHHTSVSGKTEYPEEEANMFASMILAPRMAIHYSRCRNAENISRVFKITYEAAGYALVDYYRWYEHVSNYKMSAVDKAMYLQFYDPTEKCFIWSRYTCPKCGHRLINHTERSCPGCLQAEREQKTLEARMIASCYTSHEREPWLPEGFEQAEYRYLYGDMY